MKSGPLTDRPKTELAAMARRKGVRDWDSLNKVELVKALSRVTSPGTNKLKPVKPLAKPVPKSSIKKSVSPSRPARVTVKSVAKVTTQRAAKPVTKSAAGPARSTTNGQHRHPPLNGSQKHALKRVAPAATVVAKGAAQKLVAARQGAGKPAVPAAPPPVKELPARLTTAPTKDRIILAVNDPYWLHVMWDLSAHSVQRAEAALKQDWYNARLIIRLSDVTSQDTTSTSETPIRDIPVEGDGRNWYINVPQPPRQYRADIGYISRRGEFFVLARSNVVTPPKAGSPEALDAGWEKDPKKAERILAMSTGFESSSHPELKAVFEERLRRPLGAPKETGFGSGATPPGNLKKFFFDIDAKLIVYGRTDPTAHLTLGNDPIDLSANGTFLMEFSLPDSRQIIPAVAISADGVEERTIVLAVERNTKYLDPMIHDQMNEV